MHVDGVNLTGGRGHLNPLVPDVHYWRYSERQDKPYSLQIE